MVNSRPLLGINTTADAGQPQSTRLNKQGAGYQKVRTLLVWCVIAAFWGSMINWHFRNAMNPDGISYLDIAERALRYGPSALVNTYWSPAYPALIACWEWIFKPSAFSEFAAVHALNAVLYALAATSFAYFLYHLIRFRLISGRALTHGGVFIAFSFGIFLRFMNADILPFAVTPDLLVAVLVFAAAGLFFRILSGCASPLTFAWLGMILALGYWAKAVMFPAGIVLLCILLLCDLRSSRHVRGVLLAAVAMCLLAAPGIVLISQQLGHVSISDAGRLNYLWYMDRIPLQGWTGSAGGDVPEHGPRILVENPKVIEFSSPVPGTYPLWYNPSYWYAGAKLHFSLARQFQLIWDSVRFYRFIFSDWRLPFEGMIAVWILAYANLSPLGWSELKFICWPAAILLMYSLVVNEYRYIAPFLIISYIAAYSAGLHRLDQAQRVLLIILTSVLILTNLKQSIAAGREVIWRDNLEPSRLSKAWLAKSSDISVDQIVARKLTEMGLKAGDKVATAGDAHLDMGDGFQDFCAHIDRLRIVAEIVDSPKFWRVSPKRAEEIERKLAKTGARVLLAQNKPKNFQPGRWKDIPQTDYSILVLWN